MSKTPDVERYHPNWQDNLGVSLMIIGGVISTWGGNPEIGIPLVIAGGILARKEIKTKARWITGRRTPPAL